MPACDEVSLFTAPLSATDAWRNALAAHGGVCGCRGACGNSHAGTSGRCPHALSAGYRLHLTGAGDLLCARCLDKQAAAARKAERAARQHAPQPNSLLDLLAGDGGLT